MERQTHESSSGRMSGRKDPRRIDVQTEGGRTKTQTTELMGGEINHNTGSLEVIHTNS